MVSNKKGREHTRMEQHQLRTVEKLYASFIRFFWCLYEKETVIMAITAMNHHKKYIELEQVMFITYFDDKV